MYKKYPRVKLIPNDPFWKEKANTELIRLQEVVGDDEGRRMTDKIEGTWKSIFASIKIIADLAEAQKAVSHITNNAANGSVRYDPRIEKVKSFFGAGVTVSQTWLDQHL